MRESFRASIIIDHAGTGRFECKIPVRVMRGAKARRGVLFLQKNPVRRHGVRCPYQLIVVFCTCIFRAASSSSNTREGIKD